MTGDETTERTSGERGSGFHRRHPAVTGFLVALGVPALLIVAGWIAVEVLANQNISVR